MKIIIVGAGVCGLSTYLHLRKYLSGEHTITIYESHRPRASNLAGASNDQAPDAGLQQPLSLDTLSKSTVLVGGGLGIAPNGMRVLLDLDPELHAAFKAQGFPTETWVFKGANGWTLGRQPTSDKGIWPEGKHEVAVASSRHGLWETLFNHVRKGVVKYGKVISIEQEEGARTKVTLVDEQGNEETDVADLLIGADGSRSAVRTALFGDEEAYQPQYTGQCGVGGFVKQKIPDEILNDKRMVFTFGGNGFFGYSSSGPASAQSLMWWSTFETSSIPQTQAIDPAELKQALLKRHERWNDPILHDIIKVAEVQSIYPTWVVPELPHWGERGIVLVGDAAHALDPTTGQGACQALEDSQTLSLLLARCLKLGEEGEMSGQDAVGLAIKLFHDIRKPRVKKIVERGKKLAGSKSDVGIVGEYFMYFFFWMLTHFPSIGKAIIGDTRRELFAWSAEAEVERALKERDPTWLYEQTRDRS